MATYHYYLVESAFVVRVNSAMSRAERLLPDGTWVAYPDLWDVATNGRYIDSEQEAMETARRIRERDAAWRKDRSPA